MNETIDGLHMNEIHRSFIHVNVLSENSVDTIWDVKAVSSKVQVPPLLRQRHNAARGLPYES